MKKRFTFAFLALGLPFIAYNQVTTILTGLNEPSGLEFKGNELFIAEYGNAIATEGKILKTNITDASPTATDVITNLTGPWHLKFKDNDLFIAHYWESEILKSDVSIPNPTIDIILSAGINGPSGLELVGNDLYISDYNNPSILKIDITEISPTANVILPNLSGPTGLLHHANEIYVANYFSGSIYKFNINQPLDTISILTGLNAPDDMVLYGNHLFYSEYGAGTISKLDLSTTDETPQVLASNLEGPTGIAIKEGILYFTERTGGKLSKIYVLAGDSDDNGIIDGNEIAGDIDGNGTIDGNELAGDIDGSGAINGNEELGDTNGNGTVESPEICGDANGNGTIDNNEVEFDCNGDGIADNVGIEKLENSIELSLYPNPNNGVFTLKTDAIGAQMNVISIDGRVILSKTINSNVEEIQLDVEAGTYFVQIKTDTSRMIERISIK